jgi:L-lactate utilization protein LutB
MIQLDNGRTKVLADMVGRAAALHCIRCSACLN